MSILAIDYWEKRVWIAIEVEKIAIPFGVIERHKIIKELKKIIKNKNINKIIIWKPFDLYWNNSKILNKTLNFSKKLEEIFPEIEIDFVDERFTSKIIDSWKTKRDDMSASLILETYLDIIKNKQKL